MNDEFADADPSLMLRWVGCRLLPPGSTGLVILHLLLTLDILQDGRVPVMTSDMLHVFPQSYGFYDTVRSQNDGGWPGGMELVIARLLRDGNTPSLGVVDSWGEFDLIHGLDLWRIDPDVYAELTKVSPLRITLGELWAWMWITGRRRSSGGERSDLRVLEFEYHRRDNSGGGGDAVRSRLRLVEARSPCQLELWRGMGVHPRLRSAAPCCCQFALPLH